MKIFNVINSQSVIFNIFLLHTIQIDIHCIHVHVHFNLTLYGLKHILILHFIDAKTSTCKNYHTCRRTMYIVYYIYYILFLVYTYVHALDVIGVHPSSSDGMLSVMQSNGSAEELHQRSVSPSLNSSLSSEHSQASSVCSSLSTTSKESRGDTSGLENGPGTTRRIGGKIPKPASK